MKNIYLLLFLLVGCSEKTDFITPEISKINNNLKQEVVIEKKVNQAWMGTYWGMDSGQLINLFPVQEKNYNNYCPEGYLIKDCKRYELEKQKIGSNLYDVSFNFIKNQLANINFVCSPDINETRIQYFEIAKCANEIEFLLKEKYGNYNFDDIKFSSGKGSYIGMEYEQTITKKTWMTNEKEIKYFYLDCSGECSGVPGEALLGYRKLSVSHTPNANIFKVKSDIYDSAKDKI